MPRHRRTDRDANQPNPVLYLLVAVAIVAALFYYQRHHHGASPSPQVTQTRPTPSSTPGTEETAASRTTPASPSMGEVNLLLGNPSGATTDPANRNNYLMIKPYFALAYNDSRGTANWVSWRVTAADLGDAPRKQLFDPDTTLPATFHRITHKDYSGSGFDRGHLCPHSDRAATQETSFATFVMTNIIPQAPHVNQKAWAHLEEYCRALVSRHHNHLYIIAGPLGRGGVGSAGERDTIAGGAVTVPAQCWKIIVVIPDDASPGDDLANISPDTRVIAILMPNDNTAVGDAWAQFRTTPADIEQRTGLKFFTRLPPATARALENQLDSVPLSSPRRSQS